MEFSTLIEDRRSIRDYAPNVTVLREEIEQMIYAAQQAPSWKNSQTGRYYVALGREALDNVRNGCLASFNLERTANASAFIVTSFKCGISGFTPDGIPTDSLGNGWGAYDLGLQNSNFLLKARELGYDTLIMGLRNEAELKKIFAIPDDEIIVSVIALGKRASDPNKPQRKDISQIAKFF